VVALYLCGLGPGALTTALSALAAYYYFFPLRLDGQSLMFYSSRDITERMKVEAIIKDLAFYDPLTHLPNRRLLADRLSLAMGASKRDERFGALLLIDLDNFKPLNDTHGHAVGDTCC
jgi:PleD family two-component response regulator